MAEKMSECSEITDSSTLYDAVILGDENIVRLLLDRGADVNVQGGQYGTALHAALHKQMGAVVRLLLRNSAKLDCQDLSGQIPLHVAVEKGFLEGVHLLLDASTPTDISDFTGTIPFLLAFAQKKHRIVQLLLPRCTAELGLFTATQWRSLLPRAFNQAVEITAGKSTTISVQSDLRRTCLGKGYPIGSTAKSTLATRHFMLEDIMTKRIL